MRRSLGYLLMGLGFLIFWPVQIGIALYGLFYVVKAFMDAGIVAGLISIPIAGVSLGIIYFIIHIVAIPYMSLTSLLLGKEKTTAVNQQEINELAMEADRKKYEAEEDKSLRQMLSEDMTTEEVDAFMSDLNKGDPYKHDEERT